MADHCARKITNRYSGAWIRHSIFVLVIVLLLLIEKRSNHDYEHEHAGNALPGASRALVSGNCFLIYYGLDV